MADGKLTDSEAIKRRDSLKRRHRFEWATLAAEVAIGRSISETARLLEVSQPAVQEWLDLFAAETARGQYHGTHRTLLGVLWAASPIVGIGRLDHRQDVGLDGLGQLRP